MAEQDQINPEQFGLTQEQWDALHPEDKQKLSGQQWTTKPCDICGKDVSVLGNHTGKTWCLEHRGKWGVAQ